MTIYEANIPKELRKTDNWVGWREVKQKDGLKKIPISPYNLSWAKVNDFGTWDSYERALDIYIRGKVDGIGFVFSLYDPFIGVDLDNCIKENGKVTPEAKEIVKTLDSYTEVSPSGKGLHIIIKSDRSDEVPPMRRKGLEIYPSKRFFTITSNLLIGFKPVIAERHSEIMNYIENKFADKLIPANVDTCPLCSEFKRTGVHAKGCPRYVKKE